MRRGASPGLLPTLGLPVEAGRDCGTGGRPAHTKPAVHSFRVFPKIASGFPLLESGRRGPQIWMSGSIAISVSTLRNEASMCPMKGLRMKTGQPSCFQRKGGTLAARGGSRRGGPSWRGFDGNVEVVTQVQAMESRPTLIFLLSLHYQRLAVTVCACLDGRHVAIQAGEFAFRSNRADRAWFGRDRIRM